MTNLVAHYDMNDNTNTSVVIDSRGFSNGTFRHIIGGINGTENTNINSISGKIGRAFHFDAVTKYIDTGSKFWEVFTNSFWVNIWIQPDEGHPIKQQIPIGAFKDEDNFNIFLNPTGKVEVYYQLGAENGVSALTPNPVFAAGGNQPWTMITAIVMQLTSTTIQAFLYVNAQLAASSNVTNYSMTNYDSPRNLWIGAASPDILVEELIYGLDDDTTYPFAGGIDDVSIFTGIPTQEKITELYLMGRDGGYYRIYRGRDGIIDYDNVVGLMTLADTNIQMINPVLPPNSIWTYVRRRVSDCGLESPDSPPHKIIINSEGTMILSTPNVVQALTVQPLAGGFMQLQWQYIPTEQEVIPTGFKIFIDSGSGFDFANPAATVAYKRTWVHKWKSAALNHDQTYKFCVRSYTANAGETINTNFVSAKADSVGPDAAQGLSATWEEI
jgi:hypothetical protein